MPRQPTKPEFLPAAARGRTLALNPSAPIRSNVGNIPAVEPYPWKENWHFEAFMYSKACGPVDYVMRAKADLLSRCNIRPEVRIPNSENWEPTEDPRVQRVLRAFVDKNGSQGALLGKASKLAEKAGRGWLYGTPHIDRRTGRVGRFSWDFLSTSELQVERRGQVNIMSWGRGVQDKKAPPDGIAHDCLFYPDDEYSDRSTSPIFNVLPQLKQWVLCSQVIDAIAASQLNAQMLFIPHEVSFGPPDEFEDPADPSTGFDEFEEELHDHTGRSVSDNSSPTRLNPLLLRGPAVVKVGDKAIPTMQTMGLVTISRELDTYLQAIRNELLLTMAWSLDCPPEVMMGNGAAAGNHWDSWLSDDQFIQRDVVPLGNKILNLVTKKYLRPMLVMTGMTEEEADWFRLSLDEAPITANPDKSAVATTAHQALVLSDESWMENLGLDIADIASNDEKARRLLADIAAKFPSTAPNALPFAYPDVDFGPTFDNWVVSRNEATDPAPLPTEAVPGPDVPPQQGASVRLDLTGPSVIRMLTVAADAELLHALETGGARLIGVADPDTKAQLRRVQKHQVLTAGGAQLAKSLHLGSDQLFAGCFDELGERVTEWLINDQVGRGVDHYQARVRSQIAAAEMVQQLVLLAASSLNRALFRGPNGVHVPDALVISALRAGDLVELDTQGVDKSGD